MRDAGRLRMSCQTSLSAAPMLFDTAGPLRPLRRRHQDPTPLKQARHRPPRCCWPSTAQAMPDQK